MIAIRLFLLDLPLFCFNMLNVHRLLASCIKLS